MVCCIVACWCAMKRNIIANIKCDRQCIVYSVRCLCWQVWMVSQWSKIVTAGTINIQQCQHCSPHPRKTFPVCWVCWSYNLNTSCRAILYFIYFKFYFPVGSHADFNRTWLTGGQLLWLASVPFHSSMYLTDGNAQNKLLPLRWWTLLALLFMSTKCVLLHANVLAQAGTIKITHSQEHEDHREWNTTPPTLPTNNSHHHLWLTLEKLPKKTNRYTADSFRKFGISHSWPSASSFCLLLKARM